MDGAAALESDSLRDLHGAMAQLLSFSQHGLAWVDPLLRVLSCNAMARQILCTGDGVRLREQRIVFSRSEVTRDLAAFMASPPTASPGHSVKPLASSNGLLMRRVERPSGKAPYFIAGMRLAPTAGVTSGMLLIEDLSSKPCLQPDVCRTIYGLTPAESRVAMRLIDGRSAPGIASDLNLSTLTVRTHIKHIFKKVNVRSQAQLMASLYRITRLPIGVPSVQSSADH